MQPTDPLKPEVELPEQGRESLSPEAWLQAHALSVASCALGVLAFVITTGVHLSQGGRFFSDLPARWLTIPFLVATFGLGTASLLRRERGLKLVAIGVTCAATSVVLGWFVAAAIIIILALVVIMALQHSL